MRQNRAQKKSGSEKIAGIVLLALGAAFLAYFMVWAAGVIHWSFDIGVCFILVCGILMAGFGILLLQGGAVLWFGRHRAIRAALLAVLMLFLLSFAVIEGLVFHGSARNDSAVKADFVLIPGATVVQGRPSLILQHRLDGAIAYIHKNPAAVVIVSGARGKDEAFSEAEVMKEYLVSKGIDGKRIIEEDKATDTIENVANAQEIMESYHLGRNPKLMIISSNFHLFRAMLLARAQGLNAYGIAVPVHYSVAPICYCREYFSVMKLFLTGLQAD